VDEPGCGLTGMCALSRVVSPRVQLSKFRLELALPPGCGHCDMQGPMSQLPTVGYKRKEQARRSSNFYKHSLALISSARGKCSF
jgi:hypothetical protein